MGHPKRTTNRLGVALLTGLALYAWLCVCAAGSESTTVAAGRPLRPTEHVVLQLKWKPQFQFAGYYAAVAKGYYREAGLDVTLVEGSPERRPIDEVLSGRANFAVANAEVLLYRLEGKPVVALAVVFQHSPSVFLARRDSGIASPQDMVGKRIMLRKGVDSAELLAVLKNEGIALDKIQRQSISYNVQDLIDGKTDVYHAYITQQPFYLEQRGVPVSIIRPMTYGIDFYGDTLFTDEQEIAAHPDRVRAFRAASIRGWEYAMDHPDEVIELILRDYFRPKPGADPRSERELMRALLRYEAAATRKLMYPDVIEIGHMNPGRWRHIAETYAQLGMIKAPYSLDGFLYDPNPVLDYAWLWWWLRIALASGLLAAFAAAALFVFNRRLAHLVAVRTEELQHHREHLEEQVAARTADLTAANAELKEALEHVKILRGLLPICSSCKKVRDDGGYWHRIEDYISDHSEADFSHGICPECAQRLYPDYITGANAP